MNAKRLTWICGICVLFGLVGSWVQAGAGLSCGTDPAASRSGTDPRFNGGRFSFGGPGVNGGGPGYGGPGVGMNGPGFGGPAMAMNGPGFGGPAMAMNGPGFGAPVGPMSGPGYGGPGMAMNGPRFGAPGTGGNASGPSAPPTADLGAGPQYGQPAQQWSYSMHRSGRSAMAPTGMMSPANYSSRYGGAASPRVEVEVSDASPYLHQTVVYTVRVVSDSNILTIKPVVPTSEGVILEVIDGPNTTMRYRGGRPEIVNEYHFALTPLKAGKLIVPPFEFTGTVAANNSWRGRDSSGGAFDVAAGAPLSLQIKEAETEVRPWLPLHDLSIEGEVDSAEGVDTGKPLSFHIKLAAVGARGERLPTVEPQLQGSGFRVYREDVKTEQAISKDGHVLLGRRIESYTLVPTGEEALGLPSLRVAWWNVDEGKREEAVLPMRSVLGLPESSTPGRLEAGLLSIWTPFWVILAGTLGYWLGIMVKGSLVAQKLGGAAVAGWHGAGDYASAKVAYLVGIISLRQHWCALKRRLVSMLPQPLQLWSCVRGIRNEDDPSAWCQAFKQQACRHLGLPSQATLAMVAERLGDSRPRSRADVVRGLIHELDRAIYGGEALDFWRWKRRFARVMHPFWLPIHASALDVGFIRGLPHLNPHRV